MVITMAKLRMAHASTHGARIPPGPIHITVISSSVYYYAGFLFQIFSGGSIVQDAFPTLMDFYYRVSHKTLCNFLRGARTNP